MVQQTHLIRNQKAIRGRGISRLIDADLNELMTRPEVLDRILQDIASAPGLPEQERERAEWDARNDADRFE